MPLSNLPLVILKLLVRPTFKKALKNAAENPEVQKKVDAVNKSSKELDDAVAKYRKRYPNRKLPWED